MKIRVLHFHSQSASALGPLFGLMAVIVFFAIAEFSREAIRAAGEGRDFGQFVGSYESNFLTLRNARTVLVQTCTVGMAALGMTLIIMSGGIDLSAGSTLALAATVLAYVLNKQYGVSLALLCAVATGALAGCLNGVLISRLRLAPFIVTLGTMTVFLGVGKLIAGGIPIRPALQLIPKWLDAIVSLRPAAAFLYLPISVWLTIAISLIMSALIKFTVFGRHVRAVGSNEPTAILCGINVPRLKVLVYSLAGALIGIAGIFQFAKLATGNPMSGTGWELRMIAAVVIGGASLNGGRGSMIGTLLGAGITTTIANGCTMLELENPLQEIVLGVIIVAAVLIDRVRSRA